MKNQAQARREETPKLHDHRSIILMSVKKVKVKFTQEGKKTELLLDLYVQCHAFLYIQTVYFSLITLFLYGQSLQSCV